MPHHISIFNYLDFVMSLSSFSTLCETWPPRIRPSSHHSRQYASPSGRWPWVDRLDSTPLPVPTPLPSSPDCAHAECGGCWMTYPQSLFQNWTLDQMRSGFEQSCVRKVDKHGNDLACVIYQLDVGDGGQIMAPARYTISEENTMQNWEVIKKDHPKGVRVRVIFIDDLSEPALQMLGTRYKVDPFFFSSSINWTSSQYQDVPRSTRGDRITFTLTFPSTIRNPMFSPLPPLCAPSLRIDTRAPLDLRSSGQMLFLDMLAVHMIRAPNSSTIISNHLAFELRTTSAKFLHSRIRSTAQSPIWEDLLRTSRDPTLMLLMMFWHVVFAWDMALDALYEHFVSLETRSMMRPDEDVTQELHVIRPHLLRYFSLLQDFRKSVIFVIETPNTVMDSWTRLERYKSKELLRKEGGLLLSEINRLEMSRGVLEMRLANFLSLVSSSFNFVTSRQTRELTEAAVRDSAAMKQISYLTMVFLPASFVASVFGMNIKEISPQTYGSLAHYFGTAIPLTVVTVWVIVAFQSDHYPNDPGASIWTQICWPLVFVSRLFVKGRRMGKMGSRTNTLV